MTVGILFFSILILQRNLRVKTRFQRQLLRFLQKKCMKRLIKSDGEF